MKDTKPSNPTQFVTRAQAAEITCASEQTIDKWIRSGKLPAFRPGGARKVLIRLEDLLKFVEAGVIE